MARIERFAAAVMAALFLTTIVLAAATAPVGAAEPTADSGSDGTVTGKPEHTKGSPAMDPKSENPDERVEQERPRGDCSIAGKVVEEGTGRPVAGARMYLFYVPTFSAMFANTDASGTFAFEDIPAGPYTLRTSHAQGYQDATYNPESMPGRVPRFALHEDEHRSGIVLEVKPACRVAGRVLDENGKTPEDAGHLTALAWFREDDGRGYGNLQGHIQPADGSFTIDGLDNKPVYVMAIDWRSDEQENVYPPVYYPGTCSRSKATQVTFDQGRSVEGIDITLRKGGGLAIAGTVRDEAGNPIPEAFIVADRPDMLFDFVTAYSDADGNYEIHGLGDGDFLVHVDAAHRGFVRTCTAVTLDGRTPSTRRDFTLARGVAISGRLVDEEGNPWEIAQTTGAAHVRGNLPPENASFTLTGFDSRYAPRTVRDASGSSFQTTEGPYFRARMYFPTKTTFLIQGLMAGHTVLNFMPQKEGQKVTEIRYDGHDVRKSGIDTEAGQEIREVTIVIGRP